MKYFLKKLLELSLGDEEDQILLLMKGRRVFYSIIRSTLSAIMIATKNNQEAFGLELLSDLTDAQK
jgi:hypothetical protein